MNVLSLFNGMNCGRIALERAGIPVTKYYASEIKPHAIKITNDWYPDTIHIGDVTKIQYLDGILFTEEGTYNVGKIDLLIGGSPCQDFSFLKSSYTNDGSYGLLGEKSKLFHHYDRLRKETECDYFLLENVKMKKTSELELNKYLGVKGFHINSSLVSAQNRQRIYWTNIPGISKPIDKGISLQSILQKENLSPYKVNRTPSRDNMWFKGKCKNITFANKSSCLTTKMDRWNNAGLIAFEDYCRFLTPHECEKLQNIPEGYTDYVTLSQAYDLLGDGWTVDIIAHIFEMLKYTGI